MFLFPATRKGAPIKPRKVAITSSSQSEPADTERAWDRHGFRVYRDGGQRGRRRWGWRGLLHSRSHTLRTRKTAHARTPPVSYVQTRVRRQSGVHVPCERALRG